MTEQRAAGRILVVEDEALIAMMITATLQRLGFEVVGPVSKLAAAVRLVEEQALDGAILDVTVRGGKIYPVAEQLLARGIPVVLATGHGDWALPENLRALPRLTKPFTQEDLEEQIKFGSLET